MIMANQKSTLAVLLTTGLLLVANSVFGQAEIKGEVHIPEGYQDTVFFLEMEKMADFQSGSSHLLIDQAPVDHEGRFSLTIPEEDMPYDTTFYRLTIVPEDFPGFHFSQYSGNSLWVALHDQSRVKVRGGSEGKSHRPKNLTPRGLVKVTADKPMFWQIVEGSRQNMAIQSYNDHLKVPLIDTVNSLSYEAIKERYPKKDSLEAFQQLKINFINMYVWYMEEKLTSFLDTVGKFYPAIQGLHNYATWVSEAQDVSDMPFLELKHPLKYHLGNAKKYLNNLDHYVGNPYFNETEEIILSAWDEMNTAPSNDIDASPPQVDTDLHLPGIDEDEYIQLIPEDKEMILVDFFASWCAPCVHDHKNVLPAVYEDYHDMGLSILTLSVDRSLSDFREYQEETPVPWRETFLPEEKRKEIYNAMKADPSSLPYYMLIDREGNVLEQGFRLTWGYHIIARHLPGE